MPAKLLNSKKKVSKEIEPVNELMQNVSDVIQKAIVKLNPADKNALNQALQRTPNAQKTGLAQTQGFVTGPDAVLAGQLNNLLAKGGLK